MSRSTVTYQELTDLEADFDDFNVELLRSQTQREAPLYARRAALVSRISGFWPLVFEQAPADIDQYIQPNDANVLFAALKSVDVTRFDAEKGDPRSIAIKFTFAENEFFEDTVLEKRFWYRQQAPSAEELKKVAAKNEKAKAKRAASGKKVADNEDEEEVADNWAGLVSEPVKINWKAGKDLTEGLLDLAHTVYQEVAAGKDGKTEQTEAQKQLQAKLEETAVGAVSFFNWFGYVGRYVTEEESKIATADDLKQRAERSAKWAAKAEKFSAAADAMEEDVDEDEDDEDEDDDEEDDDEDDEDYAFDIFADGDTVALAIAEDLWPNAIKYFYDAQEHDSMGDMDFDESDDEEDEEEAPPLKKQKN